MKSHVLQCLIILVLVSNYSFAQKSDKKNKTYGNDIEQLTKEVRVKPINFGFKEEISRLPRVIWIRY